MLIDVVIPASSKPTVERTIRSLLSSGGDQIRAIYVIGAPDETTPVIMSQERVCHCEIVTVPFSKAALLNHGIKRTCAAVLLTSDADVIWNYESIEAMSSVINVNGGFCHIAEVEESDQFINPQVQARLTPVVTYLGDSIDISIARDMSTNRLLRPGPGLMMGLRSAWMDVGGFNEALIGWGWEDQDFIIRAHLLGYSLLSAGRVLHLSHHDATRNVLNGGVSKIETRDANIGISTEMIRDGKLRGPLCSQVHTLTSVKITVDSLGRSA